MSRFLQDASEIFETASAAPHASSPAFSVLIHGSGQIHIVDGGETPLDVLQTMHGCRTAYRVTLDESRVRVEGRDGGAKCLLEKAKPMKPVTSLGLFYDRPLYSVAETLALQ